MAVAAAAQEYLEDEEEEDEEEEHVAQSAFQSDEEGEDCEESDGEGGDMDEGVGNSKKRKAPRRSTNEYRSSLQTGIQTANIFTGRARPQAANPVGPDSAQARGTSTLSSSTSSCTCQSELAHLAETTLLSAKRTPSEQGLGEWNFARLKPHMEFFAFDARGNFKYHNACLCKFFNPAVSRHPRSN